MRGYYYLVRFLEAVIVSGNIEGAVPLAGKIVLFLF